MEVRTAYCSACDREVRVVLQPGQEPIVVRDEDASELVCLEYGETCTGDMCPLFQVPTGQMRDNLARHLSDDPDTDQGR